MISCDKNGTEPPNQDSSQQHLCLGITSIWRDLTAGAKAIKVCSFLSFVRPGRQSARVYRGWWRW